MAFLADGPLDDIIIFASSARYHKVSLHILNDDFYGYTLVPMEAHNTIEQEMEQFTHIKLENIGKQSGYYYIV